MKRVIKNQKKMKNTMYIVFGVFALALFGITIINPSYASEGLIIDDALDAIVLYGEVETVTEDENVNEVQDVDIPVVDDEGDEDSQEIFDNETVEKLEMVPSDEGKTGEDEENVGAEIIKQKDEILGDDDTQEETHGISTEKVNIDGEITNNTDSDLLLPELNKIESTDLEILSDTITIKYHPNGGAFSGMSAGEIQDVVYTKGPDGNYIPDINLQFPNRISDNISTQSGWMFAGWYTTPTNQTTEWLGIVEEGTENNKIVYAKWLPFNDLRIQVGDISLIVMDRNMGAESVANGGFQNTDSQLSWGYYYQWGNNYGFRNDYDYPPNSGTTSINDAGLWGPGNYYSSSKFLKVGRYSSLYNKNFKNLWGGVSGTYEAMQGPCPVGYHIPDGDEWKDLNELFKNKKDLICNQSEKPLTCLMRKLKLPHTGWLLATDGSKYKSNANRYQASTINDIYFDRYNNSLSISNSYSRGGDPIRCFKNSESPKKDLVYETNGGTVPESPKKVARSWGYIESLPKSSKNGFVFVGWYTTPNFQPGTEVTDNNIVSDNDVVTVYAKRRESYDNIVITYDANGGLFSGDKETMQVIYTEQLDGSFISDINLQFPDRKSENISIQSGWMFAGWYLESGNYENQTTERYTQSDELNVLGNNGTKTVYAKRLPFNDLTTTMGGISFTIMDRNLGAEMPAQGDGSQENQSKIGYYYQWGNNYGFKVQADKRYTYGGRVDIENKGWGPGNYYSSSSYNTNSSWTTRGDSENLRGGKYSNNSDEDKQGPCPAGYHIPDIGEWSAVVKLFERERILNANFCDGYSQNEKGICFASKLQLPFAGYYSSSALPYSLSFPYTRYQSSSPNEYGAGKHLYFYEDYIDTDWLSNGVSLPIRCFRNSNNIPLTISFDNDGKDENIEYSLRRWDSVLQFKPDNPTRKGYRFIGWKENEEVFEFKDNIYIAGATIVNAEWNKNPRYELNANGGYFRNGSGTEIIKSDVNMLRKVSHTPNIYDNGEKYKGFDYSSNMNEVITIKGAEKLKIVLKYGGNSSRDEFSRAPGDCVVIWEGNHPTYKVYDNYESSITQKLCDYRSIQTKEYEIEGDTITIGFSSDGTSSSLGVNYGYYAVISDANSEKEYEYEINDEILSPRKEGYTFLGRYETGATERFDFTGTEINQDRILYAKWEVNNYIVSFNSDNGETNPGNITVTYDSQYPELPVVNKTGYTFNGWYNGEEKINSGDVVRITEDTTLKAKRTINQYKIMFDTDGGNEISSIEKDYNSSLSGMNLPTPTKECNAFSGWDIELPERMPAHDITLKAVWNYTCSRSSGGGGSKKAETSTREVAVETPTEKEHNSADEKENKTETPITTPLNVETSNQVISITQEISEDGTIEAVVETVKIKNTDIVATVRTEVNPTNSSSSSSSSATHTKEQNDAYSFAKSNGITTTESIEEAKMNTELTRIQMAKMLSNFAMNVLGQEPDTEKGVVKFDDVTNKMDKQYDNAVTKAYQLGIMGQNVKNNEFRPNDTVTRAEFASSLSRLLYHTEEGEYKGTGKYYVPHIAKLYNEGIINKADPKIKEKRGYVMTMLKRTVD